MSEYDHSRFMKNYWRARLCHGCKYLHVGRNVGHNHCDYYLSSDLRDRIVNNRLCEIEADCKCRQKALEDKNGEGEDETM